jgi:hypothetical protein
MTRGLMAICAGIVGLLLTGGVAVAGSIEINPALKGADLETAQRVKTSLEGSLKQCQACQVKIDSKNGAVDLSGNVPPEFHPALKNAAGVPGVKSLNAGNIKSTGVDITTKAQKMTPGMPKGSVAQETGPSEVQVSEHVARKGADRKMTPQMPGGSK